MGKSNINSNVAFICYSHSEYSDVWDMFFGQLNKYLPSAKKYLFTDKVNRSVADNISIVTYDNKLPYSYRVASCLEQIDEKICLFHHEDMVLYDAPDLDNLNKVYNFLVEYDVGYVKLLKGGAFTNISLDNTPIEHLYFLDKNDYMLTFAIQPTLWKVDALLDVYKNATPSTITGAAAAGSFEVQASKYLNSTEIVGFFWYNKESKRGAYHYNSSIYPHGNFITKGKWMYSEYGIELEQLHRDYGIDKSIRGTI